MAAQKHTFTIAGELFEIQGIDTREVNGAVGVQLSGSTGTCRLVASINGINLIPVLMKDINTGADVASLTASGQMAWADVPGAQYLFIEALTHSGDFDVFWNYRDG